MGVNRSLFVHWVLIGTLTSLVVVYVAHTFRNLPTPVRAGAMVSSITESFQYLFIAQLYKIYF